MKLVIDVDEEDYGELTQTGENTINLGVLLALRELVRNGTPLPKGHEITNKIKMIVTEWKADIWTDNFSFECMQKIADLIAESEE